MRRAFEAEILTNKNDLVDRVHIDKTQGYIRSTYLRIAVMMNYCFNEELNVPYGTVIELARDELKKEGFGNIDS